MGKETERIKNFKLCMQRGGGEGIKMIMFLLLTTNKAKYLYKKKDLCAGGGGHGANGNFVGTGNFEGIVKSRNLLKGGTFLPLKLYLLQTFRKIIVYI